MRSFPIHHRHPEENRIGTIISIWFRSVYRIHPRYKAKVANGRVLYHHYCGWKRQHQTCFFLSQWGKVNCMLTIVYGVWTEIFSQRMPPATKNNQQQHVNSLHILPSPHLIRTLSIKVRRPFSSLLYSIRSNSSLFCCYYWTTRLDIVDRKTTPKRDNVDSTNFWNNVQFIFRKVKNWLPPPKLDREGEYSECHQTKLPWKKERKRRYNPKR